VIPPWPGSIQVSTDAALPDVLPPTLPDRGPIDPPATPPVKPRDFSSSQLTPSKIGLPRLAAHGALPMTVASPPIAWRWSFVRTDYDVGDRGVVREPGVVRLLVPPRLGVR
jgi:hypothetical protein